MKDPVLILMSVFLSFVLGGATGDYSTTHRIYERCIDRNSTMPHYELVKKCDLEVKGK
jgi:hypothetical protein